MTMEKDFSGSFNSLFKDDNDDFIEETPQVESIGEEDKYVKDFLNDEEEEVNNLNLKRFLNLLNDDDEDEEEVNNGSEHPTGRTIFDFLDSDTQLDSEKNDPYLQNVFKNIDIAVKETISSLPIRSVRRLGAADVDDAPNPYPPPAHPPKTHRTANDMKEFAINLSPHTFMVRHRDLLKTMLTYTHSNDVRLHTGTFVQF